MLWSTKAKRAWRQALGGQAEPGLALDSEDDLFVGVLGEGGFPVVSKLEGITGKVLIAAVGWGRSDGGCGEHARCARQTKWMNETMCMSPTPARPWGRQNVAQFAPEAEGVPGGLIQRFEHARPGRRQRASRWIRAPARCIVTDAASDDLDVFDARTRRARRRSKDCLSRAPCRGADNARRLSAQVDPTGADTHYYFEYGTASCASTPSACTRTSPTDLGGGFGDREVSLELHGLAPGAYHYRVVAENSFGHARQPRTRIPDFGTAERTAGWTRVGDGLSAG